MSSRIKTPSKKRSRKKTGATRHTEKKASLVNWMILLILIGLFAAFLVYLDRMPTSGQKHEPIVNGIEEGNADKLHKSSAAEKRPPKQQFDFYTVLPDRDIEVNVYEDEEPVQAPAIRQSEKTTSSHPAKPASKPRPTPQAEAQKLPPGEKTRTSGRALYQLQVGAFRDLGKADTLKARLAFMGVESNIYVVKSADGQKIYRVRVGPNSDEHKLSRIQQQLKAENINTFMQKLKG